MKIAILYSGFIRNLPETILNNYQFYKILDCFNLFDVSIEYDAIIRLRCDILLNNKINKDYLLKEVENDKIIFNAKIWYDHPRTPEHTSINDMIWIANKKIMKKA